MAYYAEKIDRCQCLLSWSNRFSYWTDLSLCVLIMRHLTIRYLDFSGYKNISMIPRSEEFFASFLTLYPSFHNMGQTMTPRFQGLNKKLYSSDWKRCIPYLSVVIINPVLLTSTKFGFIPQPFINEYFCYIIMGFGNGDSKTCHSIGYNDTG